MLPLEGNTVVALEQAVAAPFATRQLADLGARVIKIERPGVGDFARGYDTTVKGMASYFVWLNRSKESLTLDLKTPVAQDILHQLLAGAEVFLHNLAPGAVERLGFGAGELRERYPRLIQCSISGYGVSGPYARKKAYDLLIQCEFWPRTRKRSSWACKTSGNGAPFVNVSLNIPNFRPMSAFAPIPGGSQTGRF